ncbi:MAG: DUF433 domain-containing protein [Armatimonadota bacterium]
MLTELVEPIPPGVPDPERSTWIRKTPGVSGGDACIRNTRIPVWLLEDYRRAGLTEDELLRDYPALTRDDLQLAWDYASCHRLEIDAALRENEAA